MSGRTFMAGMGLLLTLGAAGCQAEETSKPSVESDPEVVATTTAPQQAAVLPVVPKVVATTATPKPKVTTVQRLVTQPKPAATVAAPKPVARTSAPAPVRTTAAAKTYANCTAMHEDYKGGVARPGAVDKRASGHANYAPVYDRALYEANDGSDRDGDGIACEA